VFSIWATSKHLPHQIRTITEDSGDVQLGQLEHPVGLVDGVDGRLQAERPGEPEPTRRYGLVLEPDAPGTELRGAADGHVLDVLNRPEIRPERAHLCDRARRGREDEDGIGIEVVRRDPVERAARERMAAIEVRPLDLDRKPDPPLALLDHLVERRHVGPEVGPVLPARVVYDDQLAVPRIWTSNST